MEYVENLLYLTRRTLDIAPLNREVIDIGEAVAQELSLSLPVFPRLPDAKIDAETLVESTRIPFSSLARLKQRMGC